jgi:Cro/C1-type HTH DNA-binding domain
VKIRSVRANNRRRAFEVRTWRGLMLFPYSKADPAPTATDPIAELFVDDELGAEGFTYRLGSGYEGSVHVDRVLEYNQDPGHLRDLLLYELTLEAQTCLRGSSLSKREVIRRLGTSPAQFYRLLDQTNYRKSVDKLLSLLQVLDCDVELVVRHPSDRRAPQRGLPRPRPAR